MTLLSHLTKDTISNLLENIIQKQMSKEVDIEEIDNHSQKQENIIHLSGMYENWFLDYALMLF